MGWRATKLTRPPGSGAAPTAREFEAVTVCPSAENDCYFKWPRIAYCTVTLMVVPCESAPLVPLTVTEYVAAFGVTGGLDPPPHAGNRASNPNSRIPRPFVLRLRLGNPIQINA